MERRKLQPVKRYIRECGHPADWTLDLKDLDGTITSYCMGCVIARLGLKPVARNRIEIIDGKPKLIPLKLR